MKLKDCRENYYYYSEKLSDTTRYLAFVGFGIIWALKNNIEEIFTNRDIKVFGFFLILTIMLDLAQYIVGTLNWSIFHRIKEGECSSEKEEFRAPFQINWVTLVCFWLKVIMIVIAYIILLATLSANY